MFKVKKILIICIFMFCCYGLFGQSSISEPSQSPTAQYRLFRTNNRWTFIKLDTVTGKMWQLHYSLESEGGTVVLNEQDLASGKQKTSGRFTLYPTTNMWTFILIDQIEGSTWQVQWSMDGSNRFILPILPFE
jgi:hypothetical protein